MSTSQFYRQHARLMRPGTSADHAERVQEAYEAVRDLWIAEGRHAELVRFILSNWTGGNCSTFMAPLGEALVAAGEVELHRHLWTRTVKRQVASLFDALAAMDARRCHYLRLLNLDTRGFFETCPESQRDPERRAAFLLQRLCADLRRWRDELGQGGLPTDEPERIERCLQRLERPRIQVNRLPPRVACGSPA